MKKLLKLNVVQLKTLTNSHTVVGGTVVVNGGTDAASMNGGGNVGASKQACLSSM